MAVAARRLLLLGCLAGSDGLLVQDSQGPVELDGIVSDGIASDGIESLGAAAAAASAWDWAIAEAVAELHPVKAEKVMAPELSALDPLPQNVWTRLPQEDARWYWGSHHKAGTVLLWRLADLQVKLMQYLKWPHHCCIVQSEGSKSFPPNCETNTSRHSVIWFWTNLTKDIVHKVEQQQAAGKFYSERHAGHPRLKSTGPYRGVHVIRDPVAMAISGYIYHLVSNETDPMLQEIFREVGDLPMVDGVAREARFVVEKSGKDMVEAHLAAPAWWMRVRHEDFTRSSESYDMTVDLMFKHLLSDVYTEPERKWLIKLAANHDLRRNPWDTCWGKTCDHVADSTLKGKVKALLNQIPQDLLGKLKSLRKPLGY